MQNCFLFFFRIFFLLELEKEDEKITMDLK